MCCLTVERAHRAAASAGVSFAEPGDSAPAGRAELVFSLAPTGETYLSRQYCRYPYHVCRLHRFIGDPEGMATLYVQTCAGGVFEGDRLRESIVLESGTSTHVTTQAASIVHAMETGDARIEIHIEAGPGSFLEFVPEPMILFPGSQIASYLRVRMHPSATVILRDSFLQHDHAAASGVFGSLASEIRVESASGEQIFLDRFAVSGTDMAAGLPGINGTYSGHGSLTVLAAEVGGDTLARTLRDAVQGLPGIYAGISTLPGEAGAWLRVLAEDGVALRRSYGSAWNALRKLLTGRPAYERRK
jgi:urease accessory protein